MSVETITILIGIVSVLLTFGGAFGWMIHRVDSRMDRMSADLGSRMDRMSDELVEVKIAIARVEGPPRHLLTGR